MAMQWISAISFRKLARVASRTILLVSLFIFQSLPSIGAALQQGVVTSQQESSVAPRYCNTQQSDAPTRDHHQHSANCLLCCINQSRDGLRWIAVPPVAAPICFYYGVVHPQPAPREPPPSVSGWSSAWSSRSPPTFF